MSQHTILEVAAPQCVAQDFEGEIIALNLASGTYYSLRDLGAVLWRDLAAGHPVEILAALAAKALGGTQPVMDFAANATAQGLMRPATGAVAPEGEPQLSGALPAGVAPVLVFEVFDDMKSLILLDPVHEVDETRGWPSLPTNA
jgi:hypothetical protein